MEKKPRPLKQPLLSTSQWVRIAFLGILMAIITVYFEAIYEATSTAIAATMGFVTFALLSISRGLGSRSETATAFNRDVIHDRNQMLLYGAALLVTILATELGFLQRMMGLTSLDGSLWFNCIVAAIALLLVDEVIKIFLRRRRNHDTATPVGVVPTQV